MLFRIFCYPPGHPDGWGVGSHTDHGLLTLLAQDDCGGLQVREPDGDSWIDVPGEPSLIVCNLGDMLERLTEGRYRSTLHRVRTTSGRSRLSFPLFLDPAWTDVGAALGVGAVGFAGRCGRKSLVNWKHPGWTGAVVYAVAAVVLGGLTSALTRLSIARRRGRRTAVARLPAGAVIIISNHASYADGVLLALTCRRMGRSIRLLATSGVFRVPVLGMLARRLGFIPVERGRSSAAEALEVAADALRSGEAVGIFPEGRTTRDPDHWPERAKTGAVRLALETGVPIVPIAMVGTHRVLPKKRPLPTLVKNLVLRPNVLVEVGDPIDVKVLAGSDELTPVRIRELADEVMAELVALVAELRGERPPELTGSANDD